MAMATMATSGYYGGYYRRYWQCSAGSLTVIMSGGCTGPAHLPRFGGAFSLRLEFLRNLCR